MRIAHIIEPLIGAIPDVCLTKERDEQWNKDHLQAFGQICASAVKHGAEAVLITGRLFAEDYVSEAAVRYILKIIGDQPCPFVWLPDKAGMRCLSDNGDTPDNFFLMNNGADSEFVFKDARIFAWYEGAKPSGNCNILVFDEIPSEESVADTAAAFFPDLRYAVSGDTAFIGRGGSFTAERLAKMDNTGFDDREKSGFYLLKLEDGKLRGRGKIETGRYSFKTVQVDAGPEDDAGSVCEKCAFAVSGSAKYDFVRIILTGSLNADVFVSTEQIRDNINADLFCLEIFNKCTLRSDEGARAGDISLESEFIRSVLSDDTLSDTEKSRVIQCGRSALHGKELSE